MFAKLATAMRTTLAMAISLIKCHLHRKLRVNVFVWVLYFFSIIANYIGLTTIQKLTLKEVVFIFTFLTT